MLPVTGALQLNTCGAHGSLAISSKTGANSEIGKARAWFILTQMGKEIPQPLRLGFRTEFVDERKGIGVIPPIAVRNVVVVLVHWVDVLVHEIHHGVANFQRSFTQRK
ncbi:MAG: hypothetical protein R3E84_16890 [Pseudomonadales bacterium]